MNARAIHQYVDLTESIFALAADAVTSASDVRSAYDVLGACKLLR
jgi:hypothetical protein